MLVCVQYMYASVHFVVYLYICIYIYIWVHLHQSINQSINEWINQSINPSINPFIYHVKLPISTDKYMRYICILVISIYTYTYILPSSLSMSVSLHFQSLMDHSGDFGPAFLCGSPSRHAHWRAVPGWESLWSNHASRQSLKHYTQHGLHYSLEVWFWSSLDPKWVICIRWTMLIFQGVIQSMWKV